MLYNCMVCLEPRERKRKERIVQKISWEKEDKTTKQRSRTVGTVKFPLYFLQTFHIHYFPFLSTYKKPLRFPFIFHKFQKEQQQLISPTKKNCSTQQIRSPTFFSYMVIPLIGLLSKWRASWRIDGCLPQNQSRQRPQSITTHSGLQLDRAPVMFLTVERKSALLRQEWGHFKLSLQLRSILVQK